MVRRAFDSIISDPPMVVTALFLPNKHSNFKQKTNFEHQISLGNVPLCPKDIHSLLLECFITSLRCIHMMRRASDSISDPLVANTVSFIQYKLSIFKQYHQFADTRSAWIMGCFVIRTCIHCCLSVS